MESDSEPESREAKRVTPPLRDATAKPDSPNCVTIFGAGIAGLTAAHELVERGFHVQVWEKQGDARYPERGCQVGGMARTQWSRVHWPDYRSADHESLYDVDGDLNSDAAQLEKKRNDRPKHGNPVHPIVLFPQKLYLKLDAPAQGSTDPTPRLFAAIGDTGLAEPQVVITQIVKLLSDHDEIRYVYAEICYRSDASKPHDEEELVRRANAVLDLVRPYLADLTIGKAEITLPYRSVIFQIATFGNRKNPVTFEVCVLDEFPVSNVPQGTDVIIGYRVRERWLPGEHGYRFFPSFYAHLFDTMRRTPILEAVEKTYFARSQEKAAALKVPDPARHTESGATAYDNLVPLTHDVLAFGSGARPAVLSRLRVKSLEDIRQWIRVFYGSAAEGGLELDPRDGVRIFLKSLQFLTSCSARRKEYEKQSWWDFVGGDTLGPAAQRLVEELPRALVAMDAKGADARSHGIGMAQLTLDQLRPDGFRDGTLRGPTSDAWLDPWRRYLEAQGVEFIYGEIEGFRRVSFAVDGTVESRIWPCVKCYEPRYAMRDKAPEPLPPDLMPGYFILALSPLEARQIAESYRAALGAELPPSDSDLTKMAAWAGGFTAETIRTPPEVSPDFRHFVGIQFYFAEDVFWVDGHVYYPGSPWALTSVSQGRLWEDRTDWEHGYRGLLSIIIGDFKTPGNKVKRPASQCTLEEIAEEVWDQVDKSAQGDLNKRTDALSGRGYRKRTVNERLPRPLYWHIDENLRKWNIDENPSKALSGELRNGSPFPITAPGSWERRPGSVEHEYKIEHGIVLAGAHLQTFTRLPTMEAANESGRRAANSILCHQESLFRRSLCDLWNPEDSEVQDFRWYKDLDAKLCERGVPHVFDVIGSDELAKDLLKGGPSDPLDPIVLRNRILRLLGKFGYG